MLFCDVWGQSSFEVLYSLLEKGKASLWAYGGWRGWIGFCVLSKPYEIVHCGFSQLLLTRFDSFLLPGSCISSRHLTHYSRDKLSDASQIETHLTAPLCKCVCRRAHFMGACLCAWGGSHACASVKGGLWDIRDLVLYDVWHDMRRHAWNEIGCQPAHGSTCTRGLI